jgi:hypothetical protein
VNARSTGRSSANVSIHCPQAAEANCARSQARRPATSLPAKRAWVALDAQVQDAQLAVREPRKERCWARMRHVHAAAVRAAHAAAGGKVQERYVMAALEALMLAGQLLGGHRRLAAHAHVVALGTQRCCQACRDSAAPAASQPCHQQH